MKRPTVFLGEMTNPEVEDFLKTKHTVIIPTGATEQHGPHAPLLTDVLIPQEVARRVATEIGALVAPPINYALSNNLPIADASTWRRLANSWRTQGDVECYCGPGSNGSGYPLTDWSHVSGRFNSAASWQQYAGPGGWNDLDSLELGNGDQVGLTVVG